MAKKVTGPRVATANRLGDGLVVFLGAGGDWVRELHAARIAHSDGEAEALEAEAAGAARANIVVEPYLMEVEARNGAGPVPVEHRERMRTTGPTVGHSLDGRANGAPVSAA